MQRREFASQTFEHRIDAQRKHTVVACFKLRDLRPQPLDANLDEVKTLDLSVFSAGPGTCRRCRQLATACISVAIVIVAKLEKVSDTA